MKFSCATRSAAVVAILMPLFIATASHAGIDKEPFKGSCEELNDFIRRAGVTDAKHQNHPRSAGWTTFEITSTPYQLSYRREKGGGQSCLQAELKENPKRFALDYKTTRLEWQPFGTISQDCLAEKERWEKATEERERRHLEVVTDLLERYNKAWSAAPHSYRACAESEPVARAMIAQQVEKEIRQQAEKINAESGTPSDSSHGPSDTGDAAIDCSRCPK